MNRSVTYFIYCIIALGMIGLIGQLVYNPVGLFKNLLIIVIGAAIVYFIYRQLTKGKPERKEQQAFSKAARQSKKRQKNKNASIHAKRDNVASISQAKSSKSSSASKIKMRKKSDIHLTVIDGKKNKKKNRALF
ncbi:SA1362 family protein [Peribacillus sp. SCS-155]|uniref:SA1362 family protein n=1 Tax=Peribacillus sedimenti TaxID=3115297 RepID=UPI003905E9F8